MQETSITFFPVPDGLTNQQIAELYRDTVNREYANLPQVLSKNYGELMHALIEEFWMQEIDGSRFIFIRRSLGRQSTKQEFFGDESLSIEEENNL